MTDADLIRGNADKRTVFLMENLETQVLFSLENNPHVPEPSNRRPERSWNVRQVVQITTMQSGGNNEYRELNDKARP